MYKKYSFKKISKAGRKVYLLSQCESSNYGGPSIEHFVDSNVTKLGVIENNKFNFEINFIGNKGDDYSIKILNKEGVPSGAMIVASHGAIYFGRYYSKDGFNGIVYRFKTGENVRTQLYNHGILVDECLTDYVLLDDIFTKLPFDAFYTEETLNEIKRNIDGVSAIEYIAGDIERHETFLGAQVFSDGKIIIGQFKNNALNGIALTENKDKESYEINIYDNGKEIDTFKVIYAPNYKGFVLVAKKDDSGYINLCYCEKNHKYSMTLSELNDKKKIIKDSTVEFLNYIDEDAPKPGFNGKPMHKPSRKNGKTAKERLDNLIGLEDVKKQIHVMEAVYKKHKGSLGNLNLHMCFTGNPGTGKTEVARLVAEILYDIGILEKNIFIETDPSGLISPYIGQTQIKTHEIVEKAMGGVLFIDEAYNLSHNNLKSSSGNDFGEEAIGALIADMDKYNGKFCVILAGYEKAMRDMIRSNDGFESRINRFIDFPNYSLHELKEIAKVIIESSGFMINDDALEEMMQYIASKMYLDNFSNAREIKNVFQSILGYQALRTMSDPNDKTITIEDVLEFNKKKNPKIESGKTADERLADMIGLDSVKKEIRKLRSSIRKFKGLPDKTNLHMCFTGNPGTGKTEVAKLFGNILYDEGVLPTRNFVIADRSKLVSPIIGETAIKTHKLVKDSLGGVLFIDEAYSLCNGTHDETGREAIAALIQDMEEYRGKLCVILAGYTNQIEEMIKINPGFQSRINKYIEFPNYNKNELKEIAKLIIKQNGYSIDEDALEAMIEIIFTKIDNPTFANAREVRNLFEKLRDIQAMRTEDSPSDLTITIEDIKTFKED